MAELNTRDTWDKAVWDMVRCIPHGKVATYGQIAAMLGYPRKSRHVGHALGRLPNRNDVPWYRVINSQGKLSVDEGSSSWFVQHALLREEGVVFRASGRISLREFQWQGHLDAQT